VPADVNGLTATTHGLSDDRLVSCGLVLERDGVGWSGVNERRLAAEDGGCLGLLATEVVKDGVITARGLTWRWCGRPHRCFLDDGVGGTGVPWSDGGLGDKTLCSVRFGPRA
jgi:hypothetical protein